MNISERLKQVEASVTLGITSKAKSMLKAGEDVVILAAGEPDFDTPDIVKEAAVKAIKDGKTKYTPAGGTLELKEAICRKLSRDNGLEYGTDEVVISCGAKHSLYNIFQVICDPGDEVIIITPDWLSYPEMVKLAGGVPVFVQAKADDGFQVKASDVAIAITDKTRAIVINSPSNPAGVVYDEADLREIAEICVEKGVIVISDEIYEKILYDGKTHFSIASTSEKVKARTLLVNGVSKSFSMTGWRIGYIAGDKAIIKKITTLQSHSTSNPTSISQAAAECALDADLEDQMKANREKFQKRRDFLLKEFEGEEKIVPFKAQGAFYLFCDISGTGLSSMTFAQRLLEEKKVAVIPGEPFGEDGYVRISFATDMATLEEGASRIKEWINSLAVKQA